MHLSRACILLSTVLCAFAQSSLSADDLKFRLAANNRPNVKLYSSRIWLFRSDRGEDSQFRYHRVPEGTGEINEIALAPDGKSYAYSTWRAVSPQSVNGTGYLILNETDSGRVTKRILAHQANAFRLAFSPDGKLLATGSWDEHARIWSTDTGTLLTELEGHTMAIHDVEFSPDGKSLATCSADGTVRLWDCAAGIMLMTYTPVAFRKSDVRNPYVYDVAFTPDGRQIVSTHYDKSLCVWNVADQQIVSRPELPIEAKKLVISRDGQRVACFDHPSVVLWNLETGQPDPILGNRFEQNVEDIASASRATSHDLVVLDKHGKFWFCNISPREPDAIAPFSK